MKKIYFLLFIFISIILSSCMKIETKVTIDNEFNINQDITYDYTVTNDALRKQLEEARKEAETNTGIVIIEEDDKYIVKEESNSGSGEYDFTSTTTISKIKNPCIEFNKKLDETKKDLPIDYKDISCENLDKTNDKVLLSYKGGNILNFVESEDGNYKINLLNILGERTSEDSKKQTKEEKEKTLQMLKAMGFDANYSIIFPSKIIRADIGEINNKELILSISDFINTEIDTPVVIIEKLDNMPKIVKKDNVIDILLEDKKILTKELILSKNNLLKSFSQKRYIELIDKIVEKLSSNSKKLQKLYKKLEKIDVTDKKYRKIIDIIIYLKAKVGLKLYELAEEK